MKLVAMDVATSTGIAVGEANSNPKCWTVDLGKAPNGRRFSKVLHLTHQLIADHKPDLIVIEAPIGGQHASAYLIGLVACIEGCAFNRGVKTEVVNLGAVRKHFLGKHLTKKHFPHLTPRDATAAIKAQVIQRCGVLGWKVESDDEADALALLDYGQAVFGKNYQAKPQGSLFNG